MRQPTAIQIKDSSGISGETTIISTTRDFSTPTDSYGRGAYRAEQDYTGKVLVLSPDVLREQYWGQKYQLLYAQSGFGCKPHSSGRAVFATSLADGETARWNREDFVGVLDDKFLPEWAKPKLAELQAQEQTDAPTMGGMNMK